MTKMRPFFILSLPRSRTAWLANLLTFGDSFCFHEPLLGVEWIADLHRTFSASNAKYVGCADAGASFFVDTIANCFPSAPVVVIRRDVDEVDASCKRIGLEMEHRTLCVMDNLLNHAARWPRAISVRYSELSFIDSLRTIWNHCAQPGAFNENRARSLMGMNIQLTAPELRRRLDKAIHVLKLAKNEGVIP